METLTMKIALLKRDAETPNGALMEMARAANQLGLEGRRVIAVRSEEPNARQRYGDYGTDRFIFLDHIDAAEGREEALGWELDIRPATNNVAVQDSWNLRIDLDGQHLKGVVAADRESGRVMVLRMVQLLDEHGNPRGGKVPIPASNCVHHNRDEHCWKGRHCHAVDVLTGKVEIIDLRTGETWTR